MRTSDSIPPSPLSNSGSLYILSSPTRFDQKQPVEMKAETSTRLRLAAQMLQSNRVESAESVVNQVLRVDPDNWQARILQGNVLKRLGKYDLATEVMEGLLELKPNDIEALMALASVYRYRAMFDQAGDIYRRVLSIEPNRYEVFRLLVLITKYRDYNDEVRSMEAAYNATQVGSDSRKTLGFALGKVFDDLQDFDKAFGYFSDANRVARQSYQYSIDAEFRGFDIVKSVFDGNYFERYRDQGIADARPVFVTGLPRSGTTLVEQILASHSDVFGGGETGYLHANVLKISRQIGKPFPLGFSDLDQSIMNEAASGYLGSLRALADGERHVTDKNLGTAVYIGLIRAMLPSAKIVCCVRDPRDQGLSLFQKDFGGAQPYCYDLQDIAKYNVLHERMMNYWRNLLPGRIYTISYEKLISDPENQIRMLLSFCDLEFDKACLAFNKTDRKIDTASSAQVRQPLHSGSIGRWRNYQSHLQPLIAELEAGSRL
jgi:tetratricopeptide (TPR) repeat protein